MRWIVNALLARERFERVKPRAIGDYRLPLNLGDCRIYQEAAEPHFRMTGWFGESLYNRCWQQKRHPEFVEYARACMAVPWLDEDMRTPELRAEFPPQHINTKRYQGIMLLAGKTVSLDYYDISYT